MKRDIKLNMGMLSETAWKIEQYLEDLERIENASGVFLEKLKEQNSVSYETLSAEWNSGIIETEGELRERLQFLKDLLDGYIAEMESFVAPENEDAMMRVDRNDIWWNLKQIDGDLSNLEDICMSIPSSYADYWHCIMDYWTDNEAAIRAEEDTEQARRERNYQKLSDFQNMIRSVLIPNMEDKMSQLWNIYKDAIVEFENTDDAYYDKAAFYYDMWSDLGDGITDFWRGTKDVLRGAVDAVADLAEGLLVLAMWSSPVVRVGQLFGMLPEYAEEKVAEMDAGILQLLQDPVNTLGAIGQNMADTVDEEGLAYGISYVATDVAVEILLEKGLGKVMEGGSKLDDVAAHMDDVAAGAEKYADDVADAVTDVEKYVDDVIEGGLGTIKYKEIMVYTADETNQWFIDNVKPDYKPPYKLGTVVKEIELIENTTFVRVYDNMPDGSGMYGSWVMKAEDIEGLTPLEIQNKFALPNTPKYVCDVELVTGTHIRVGEVNPLDGWGSGGGTQYDLIGQRTGDFKNERLLEDN